MSGPVAQAVAAAEDAYAFAQDALRRLPADVTIEVCVCVCVRVYVRACARARVCVCVCV